MADLDQLVNEFGLTDLSEFDMGAFLNAIIAMARKNGIELPGAMTMLVRSLVTLEGVAYKLLPDISVIEVIQAHIKAHQDPKKLVEDELRQLARGSVKAGRSVVDTLSQASLAMDMLTRGQMRMNLDLPGTTDPMSDIAHAADRLTMGIIVAGLFIGSSVIYYARIQPVIFGIPIIGFIGYLVALALGLWIVYQILREEHRRHKRRP